jgi:hypothetical protein
VSSGHQHPLGRISHPFHARDEGHTDIELVPSAGVRHSKFTSTATPYPSKSIVLMMKPRVGLTVFTSSFMTLLTMVVLPALSSPLSEPSALDVMLVIYQYKQLTASISSSLCLLIVLFSKLTTLCLR